ncbi:AAA family ATPase [Streptomyces sp. NPDC047017]|uniref:ATP-binding protein n=1 Tax=Streptomyces sp. NPDC047017 TaxID=3155024 RepID=UPI0033E47D44
MTEARPGAAASASLRERDEEITAVLRAVDTLCTDRSSSGGLLVFQGEAGLGKTALLTETRRIAEERGCAVWSARGGEILRSVPFNVVRQLLQPALLALLPEEAREYLGDAYGMAGPALGIAEPGDGHADPQAVCEGLVTAVRRLADRAWPLVLLIDDAHWADEETLRWLAAFAERLDDLSVLLVVTRRPGEVSGDSARLLGEVAAAAGVSDLSTLSPGATADLTRATLGGHADPPFCREVWAVTGGNPYETVELLAKVRDSELEPVEARAGELRELNRSARGGGLVARLEELGIDATRFAWAAAILGTGISLDLVARLATMDRADAARCAELLCGARILTEPDQPSGRGDGGDLEFVHPLIATAVYNSIPDALRTAMHGIAAQVVADSGLGAAAASQHLLQVHPDDDEELVDQLRQAAREHLAVGAPDAARRCLERALREPPTPDVHARVLYELGCATLLTAPATTIEHLQLALSMPGGLDGGTRVDAVWRLSQALLHNNQLEEAVRTVEAEAARHAPGPVRLRLHAVQYMWEGLHAGASISADRSARLAELAAGCTGRDNSERALLILRGFDAMARGENAEEVVELCDRALVNGRLAPGLGWTDTEWGIELLLMLAGAYAYSDRLDRAETLYNEALRAYETARWNGGHLALAHAYVGLGHRRRGRLREAEASLRESLRIAERVGRGLPLYWTATCNLVDTLLARGHVEEAWEVAERYEFAPPYPSTIVIPDPRSVRGRLLLAAGRAKEGVGELEAAEKAAAVRGHHNPVMVPWAADLARALAAEDPARAARLAADVRRQAERFGTDTAIGEALRCAAALETGQRAVRLAAQAVTYLEASPCQYEHAAARVEYGIAARSVPELNRGLALARSCGADGLAAQAREVLEAGRGLR